MGIDTSRMIEADLLNKCADIVATMRRENKQAVLIAQAVILATRDFDKAKQNG